MSGLEKMGQLFQKLKIDSEIAGDDDACYDYPVSGKPSFCKAWVLKHLRAWRPKVNEINIFTLTDMGITIDVIRIKKREI